MPRRPSNRRVQPTPLARFLGWARFMVPSGAADAGRSAAKS